MFRPFRLLMLGVLGYLVYIGFFAVPGNAPGPGDFDANEVARYEAAAWQAGLTRQEMSAFVNCTLFQRELHRYSWFRAAQSGWALSRVIVQFPHMRSRVDRVQPELEEVAAVEKAWKGAAFNPVDVARAQLDSWDAARDPYLGNNSERSVSQMAEEYGLRYGLRPDQMFGAASGRAEALKTILARGVDPDWNFITQLLASSYEALKATLTRADRTS